MMTIYVSPLYITYCIDMHILYCICDSWIHRLGFFCRHDMILFLSLQFQLTTAQQKAEWISKLILSSWRPTKIEFPSFSNLGFQTKVLVACLTPKFILRNSFFTRISMSLISLLSTFMKYLGIRHYNQMVQKGIQQPQMGVIRCYLQ